MLLEILPFSRKKNPNILGISPKPQVKVNGVNIDQWFTKE